MKNYSRRSFLELAAVGAGWLVATRLGLGVAAPLAAQPAAGGFKVRSLREKAFLVSCPYANVLGLAGQDGVLLVGGVRAGDTADFLRALDGHTGGAAVKVLYNTHWHWDHTGSNEALSKRAARIIAHENTKLWLGNEFYVDWQNRLYEPRPPAALPTETFYQDHRGQFGDETIESGLLFQAHTDGDIYVRLRGHNILAVGDLMADGVFPLVDPATGGWIGGLVDAQARLLQLADEETLIIPGSGAVQHRADLEAQHAMLVEMKARIFAMARQGKSPREMLAGGVAEGFEQWGDPTQFVLNAYAGLGRHYREVDGVV